MCTLPAFPVLRGTVVTLEPLSAAHAADFAIAAEETETPMCSPAYRGRGRWRITWPRISPARTAAGSPRSR
jgi:hypothetical protein